MSLYLNSKQTTTQQKKYLQHQLVTLINHFLSSNESLLGEEKSLNFFAGIVGLTSSAKDVTASQIIQKDDLAISGSDMTTAAPLYLFATDCSNTCKEDTYLIKFGPAQINKKVVGGKAYQQTVHQIMSDIRGNDNSFSTEKVVVHLQSSTPIWPSFILNTIGFQPRSEGQDGIFQDVNRTLNTEAESGVLVICHDIERPLDNAAAWKDLDIMRQYMQGKPTKLQIIFAVTKMDLK